VSDFEFNDLGGGNFEISGDMSFETAEYILRASQRAFEQHENVRVDMSAVDKADSAGLALLLEWMSWAKQGVAKIDFVAIPASVLAIAHTADLKDLISN
jgi:phospholipid transport system transporter-binding protein